MRVHSKTELATIEKSVAAYEEQLWGPDGAPYLEYLQTERGLSTDTIKHFRLGVALDPLGPELQARGMISIPYLRPVGPVVIRFRRPPWLDGGPKYWQPSGTQIPIFNTTPIADGGSWLVVCEGEVDTMTAHQAGLPAVGFPGASSWQDHYKTVFAGFERVIILADNDEAGLKFAHTVANDVPGPAISPMPLGLDVNDLVVQQGEDALLRHIKLK